MSCDKRVRRTAKALAAGRTPSRYKVNVANTRAGASSIDHEQEELDGNVLTHPRCRKVQREVEDYSRYNWDSDADSAGEPPEPVSADRIRADAEALAPHEERLRELCGDYDALPASDRLMLQSIREDLDASDTSDEESEEDSEEDEYEEGLVDY